MALSSQSGPDCMVGLRPRTLQGTPMYPPTLAIIRPRPVGFPSGQRGRAVNPLAQPSQVRILLPPLHFGALMLAGASRGSRPSSAPGLRGVDTGGEACRFRPEATHVRGRG